MTNQLKNIKKLLEADVDNQGIYNPTNMETLIKQIKGWAKKAVPGVTVPPLDPQINSQNTTIRTAIYDIDQISRSHNYKNLTDKSRELLKWVTSCDDVILPLKKAKLSRKWGAGRTDDKIFVLWALICDSKNKYIEQAYTPAVKYILATRGHIYYRPGKFQSPDVPDLHEELSSEDKETLEVAWSYITKKFNKPFVDVVKLEGKYLYSAIRKFHDNKDFDYPIEMLYNQYAEACKSMPSMLTKDDFGGKMKEILPSIIDILQGNYTQETDK